MFRRKRRGASTRAPRTEQRLSNVWRTRLRWLGSMLALLAVAVGIYAASQKLLDPRLFPLRHVHLEGHLTYLDAAQAQTMAAAYLGQNFFLIDIQALNKAFVAHPWIEHVIVKRRWPDSLVVQFREHIPFGLWGDAQMVDVNGTRFHPVTIPAVDWPYLRGPDGHEQTLIQAYTEASELLAEVDLELTHLVLDERRAWWLTLANGVELSLGRNEFKPRLQRFVEIYPQVLAEHIAQVAAVDLRYINGFAVRWKSKPADSTG